MVQEAGQRVVDAAGARSAMPAPSATHTSPAAVAATAAGQQPPAGLGGVGDGRALGRGLQHEGTKKKKAQMKHACDDCGRKDKLRYHREFTHKIKETGFKI